MILSRGTGVFLLIAAASCATNPQRAKPNLDAELPSQWSSGNPQESPLKGAWWQGLGHASLSAVIEEALANNHDLKAAAARLDAAAAQAKIAGADLLPDLGLGLDARRQQQNFIGLPIPGLRGGVLQSRATSFGLSLNTSWELDLWGRIRSARKAALEDLDASAAELRAAKESLAAQAAKSWLATLETRHQLDLAKATAENHRLTAEQVRSRYERGIRSPLDLRLASSSEASANAVVAMREHQFQAAVRQLQLLLGRYPGGRLNGETQWPPAPQPVPAGLPSELLERRSDLVAASRRVSAADARLRQARASLLPRISLTASGGASSDDLADLLSSQFSVWSLAGNLAQPIFEGGRLKAGVDLASARAREALEQYRSAALRAFTEVEIALAGEQWLAQRESELKAAAEEARAALRLAEERYRSGLETFVFVLESQRRSFETESQWLAVRRQRLDARIDLHLALGGGFEADDPSPARASSGPDGGHRADDPSNTGRTGPNPPIRHRL